MSESTTATKPKAEVKPKEPAKTDILNANDRCDRCSAAAFVRVPMRVSDANPEGTSLQFCSHHFNKAELGIIAFVNGDIIDERWKLSWDRHMGSENS